MTDEPSGLGWTHDRLAWVQTAMFHLTGCEALYSRLERAETYLVQRLLREEGAA